MAENATLGNYRVLRLIGDGGFARVYLGEHLYLKTYAAIKVPKLELDPGDLEDFLNEARRGVGLRHPNVLRTLECGVEGGRQPYIIMEYAPGGSVRSRYPSGVPVPPHTIITYTKQAGTGLQYIHDQGLIHQDIKPGNMMLGSNDELLLGDFGVAVVAHRTATQSMSDASGTARYMAPEQFMGKARPASDQYALAIVIYEWICGSSPFTGDIAELYYKHTHVAPPPLHIKAPTIAPAVEYVILKALAKEPRDRFPSVQDFVGALEQAGRPGSAASLQRVSGPMAVPIPTPIPTPTPVFPMPQVEEDIPTVQTQQPHWPKRSTQEIPLHLAGVEFSAPAGETVIPTVISQQNMPSPGTGIAPTVPVYPTDTPRGMPAYQVAPPPPRPEKSWSADGKQSRRMVVLLASLAIILVGGILGFYLVSNHPTHGSGGTTPTATRTVKTLTLTTPPPYSAMFGFNTRHTHYIPDETTLNISNVAQLALAWKMPTDSGIRSSPVIANGLVYITSSDNILYAFDATTGVKRWQASTGSYVGQGSFIFSSPVIVNNVLYIGSNDHHVYAFDATNGGKPLWVSATGGSIYSSPAVVGNTLYIGSTDHYVYAFDVTNGAQIWKTPTGNAIYSSPAVVNNVVYIGSDDSKLYALDASTGHILWTGVAKDHIDSSPTVVDGMVYVGDNDSRVYAFDANGCQGQSTCRPVWTTPTGNYIYSSPAVAPVAGQEILYIGSHDNTLYAFDTNKCLNIPANASCAPYWTWTAPAQSANAFESSPTVANGLVYVGSMNGNLYIYNAQTGALLWNFTTGGQIISSPTVLNGMVYVGSNDNYLYAFHL